jgi:hypothetical protein
MSDFETLRSRVEEAAEKLASAEADRHQHAETLSGLLVKLEEKFEAQNQELDFYRQRVDPLEQVNHQLADLMDRLLSMIDTGFGEASVAPIREAAAAAARILESEAMAAPPAPVAEAEEPEMAEMAGIEEEPAKIEALPEIELEPEPEAELEPEPEAEPEAEVEPEEELIEVLADAEAPEAALAEDEEDDMPAEGAAPEFAVIEGIAAEDDVAEEDMVVEDMPAEEEAVEEALAMLEDDAPVGEDATAEEAGFDDVGLDALLAETEAEAELESVDDLPDVVIAAHAAADAEDDTLAEVLDAIAGAKADVEAAETETGTDAGLDAPDADESIDIDALMDQIAEEVTASQTKPEGKVDIHALLARVEAAVEEVRARMDHAPAAAAPVAEEQEAEAGPDSAVA